MQASSLRLIVTILGALVAFAASPRANARASLAPVEPGNPPFSAGAAVAFSLGPAEPAAPEPQPLPAPETAPPGAVSPPPVAASPPLVAASPPPGAVSPPPVAAAESPWYERIKLRGYTQVRYNRLPSAVRNDDLINEQGDRSIGAGNGFIIRRARLILYGDLHPRFSIYFQPDFASSIGDQLGVVILRDWYGDIYLDKQRQFRIRLGQSKVPFGFENLQSSQNRLALDRNDALNSAVKDERDLGAFLYWTPNKIRARFAHLVSSGLKGSGDYGVIGFGVFNGQTANRPERNNNLHVIARVSYPFAFGNQFLELGGGGYYGKYTVRLADQADGTSYRTSQPDDLMTDARAHASVVLFPKPFGVTAEYNVGVGPAQGRRDPTLIDNRLLHGGYVLLSYKFDNPFRTVALLPYIRGTLYQGGKKFMTNAPRYEVKEVEAGLEFQLFKWCEVVLAYMVADRTSDRYPYRQEYGHVTRIQVQVNY